MVANVTDIPESHEARGKSAKDISLASHFFKNLPLPLGHARINATTHAAKISVYQIN